MYDGFVPEDQLRNLIRSARLKIPRHKTHNFLHILGAVLSGIKPAFLYDYQPPPLHVLATFVSLVNTEHVHQPTYHLKIVTFNDDVLLVNTSSFRTLSNYEPAFVNCSRSLSKPQFLDNVTKAQYLDVFKTCILAIIDPESEIIVDLRDKCEGACLTTLFGLFLRYPYVYYSSDEGNCLSAIPLYHFVYGTYVNTEFSSKSINEHKNPHAKTSSKSMNEQKKCHVVWTSFSVPVQLCDDIRKLARLPWYLEHSTVCLDTVAL